MNFSRGSCFYGKKSVEKTVILTLAEIMGPGNFLRIILNCRTNYDIDSQLIKFTLIVGGDEYDDLKSCESV